MNRSRVTAGSLLLSGALVLSSVSSARAATIAGANFWYGGTQLLFDRAQQRGGAVAVPSDDPGLGRFLGKLGATVSYQAGQRYIVVTSADRRTIAFTLGDTRYTVDGTTLTAPFAPYTDGGVAYLPFLELARGLYVDPVEDGATTVLQPQIAALDVRSAGRITSVTFHAASTLRFRRLSDANDEKLSLAFLGVASTLEHDRSIAATGLKGVSIAAGGTPKNPMTVVTFDAPSGSAHVLAPSDSPNTVTIAFAPTPAGLAGSPVPVEGGAALAAKSLAARDARVPVAAATASGANAIPATGPALNAPPAPVATPSPSALGLPLAQITGFDTDTTDGGLGVRLRISGDVTYEWHRLPDNRWYVDLKPATLIIPPQDLPLQNAAAASLRIKSFVGPSDRMPTVRVALTLSSPRSVGLVAFDGGLLVAVDPTSDPSDARAGAGQLAGGAVIASVVPLPAPGATSVSADATPDPAATWKFTPVARGNGRLIVIDPGHGGSDAGAARNGLVEKDLNLDVSKRLRSVLVGRGWQVKMTREGDSDVFAPNDSAHDELQSRDDIANASGARLLISMHTNSFTSSGLSGTTTYYYTPESYALAQAVHERLAATLPTKDDGIRKENFYVIHHAKMPAILVETAFLSNPADAELLHSPAFLQKLAVSIADGVGNYTNAAPLSNTTSTTGGN